MNNKDKRRYSPDLEGAKKEDIFYALTMFPYPSGSGLHCGHASVMTINDVVARYQRMQGKTVFNPFGFDAFGLPTENYAIKMGKPTREVTDVNKEKFLKQLQALNLSFDRERVIDTSMPNYYKWTQWIFQKLYKAGLVYRDTLAVNWCPDCQTVLANDQVVDGKCERCKSQTIQKKVPQWFIKITDYADRLIEDLETVDWPKETKIAQKNWIGKSEGCEIDFSIGEKIITCFTTRPDTIYGVTAVVLAPENDLIDDLLDPEHKEKVLQYRKEVIKKTAVERQKGLNDKTGVASGVFVEHPLTGEKIEVRFADYVLAGYGTGAVMMVPAHDERDFAFAKKFGIEMKQVIKTPLPNPLFEGNVGEDVLTEAHTGNGILINSSIFNGLDILEAKTKITKHLEEIGKGRAKITYKLRDWSVSRQRYRGSPIPVYYDEAGNYHLIPEEELPVVLPLDLAVYKPKGKSPLEDHPEFPYYKKTLLPNSCFGGEGNLIPFQKRTWSIWKFHEEEAVMKRKTILAILHDKKNDRYAIISLLGLDTENYTFVLGGVDDGETGKDAARREITEETGYTNISFVKKLGDFQTEFWHAVKKRNQHNITEAFLFEINDRTSEGQQLEHDENLEVLWMTKDEILNLGQKEDLRNYYLQLASGEDAKWHGEWIEKYNEYNKKGKTKTALLIHGRGNSSTDAGCLAGVQRTLEDAGVKVIFPDLSYAENYDFEKAMNDLNQYDADMVVGHSAGGYLSLQYASRKNVDNIVLLAPTIDNKYMIGKVKERENVFKFHDVSTDFGKLKNKNIKIFFGEKDDIIKPEEYVNFYKKLLPQAKIEILPGRGHMGSDEGLDSIDEVNKYIRKKSSPQPSPSEREYSGDNNSRDHIYEGVDRGLVEFAKNLRKRETNAEKVLWEILRNRKFLNLKWRRQHPVSGYIADFFCHDLQLIIEVDGSIHDKKEQKQKDAWRTEDLEREGLKVARISNDEIFKTDDIIKLLVDYISPSLEERGIGGEDKTYTRECDTLDTFMCSSFYFLRYPDAQNPDELIRKELADKMFPVDFYSGGKEHTVGHLLYSRFIHKFLFDQGYVSSPEPFKKLVHQGMVLGADGRKMGKRYGNGVDPIKVVEKYGADAVRMYLMFMGPVEQDKAWNDNSLKGVKKFIDRVEKLLTIDWRGTYSDAVESLLQKTILGIAYDIENLKLNTVVSKYMILVNKIYECKAITDMQLETLALLIAPYATELAEKIWQKCGHEDDIHFALRPVADESKILISKITLPIQVNGKVRAKVEIDAGMTEEEVIKFARGLGNIEKWIDGKEIYKVIWKQDKILSLIVK